jgi:hypothetical protein
LVPLGRKHGLPALPRADIRLHCAHAVSPAATLLAAHVRERLAARRQRDPA